MYQPLSHIHPGAKIAKNVVVEPFSSIDKDVVIGEGTWIGSNVTIMSGARIGKNVSIFPGSVISAVPQDLKFKGEKSLTFIGNNCTIRECATINRGTSASGKTIIGENCLIMAYAHIAHGLTLIMQLCFAFHSCIVMDGRNKIVLMLLGSKMILTLLFKANIKISLLVDL